MFKIGVFAIIPDENNRILFCHRCDYDLWNLPGGGLEQGESPQQGVIREVKEETGLEVGIETLSGVYSKPEKNTIVFSFICRIIGGKIQTNPEADIIKYFSFHEIPNNTSPKQIERIKDFLDNPHKTILKVQTGKSSIDLVKQGKL